MLGSFHSYFDRHKIDFINWKYLSINQKWNERDYKQQELNNERKASWELRIKCIKEVTGVWR
mgnify:CR=1 FL=1